MMRKTTKLLLLLCLIYVGQIYVHALMTPLAFGEAFMSFDTPTTFIGPLTEDVYTNGPDTKSATSITKPAWRQTGKDALLLFWEDFTKTASRMGPLRASASLMTIAVVDNNTNNNVITTLHGFCTGPNFTYDVYWDDTAGPAVVEVVNSGGTVLASGSTSPIRDILFNTSSTATFDIRVREQGNITNISSVVTVTRKNCVATEVNQTDYTNTGTNATFTVPANITHIRASVIAGGGNGGRRGGGNGSATSGGGGGASAISTFEVVASETFTVDVGAGRAGSNGSGRSATQVSSITNGSGSIVSAEGGDGAGQGSGTGGDGGRASVSTGQQRFNGGRGGNRSNNNANGIFGRGGGAGHLTGSGTNGTFSVTGTSVSPGGRGGNVGTGSGVAAGGGGAGKGSFGSGGNGGNGARGLARIESYNTEVVAPTVTVEQSAGQIDPNDVDGIAKFTATFSEPIVVSSLDCSDVTISGTAAAFCSGIVEIAPMDGTTFEITTTGTKNGSVIVSLPEASVHDIAGNNNQASTSTDNSMVLFFGSPGGVSTSLSLWLKANDGGAAWTDQSGSGIVVTANGDPTATLPAEAINFNEAITFDAAGDGYTTNLSINESVMNNVSITTVYIPRINAAGALWGEDNGGYDRFQIDTANPCQDAISDGSVCNNGIPNIFNVGIPNLNTVIYNEDAPNGSFVYASGKLENTFSSDTGAESSNNFAIGQIGNGNLPYDGKIAEVIVHSQLLDGSNDRSKVESYLAIKYGMTLDQSVASGGANYLDSQGNIIWIADTNDIYENDIFGIGRDDSSFLNQRVSKSINTGTIFTVALDNDFVSANADASRTTAFASDLQFLTFANDGGATTTQSTEIDLATYTLRTIREWQVKNTGSVGAVNVKFEGYGGYDILSDTDGDFSTTGDQTVLATLDLNGEATGITFTDGAYITLAFSQNFPGGVTGNNFVLWLKADQEVYTDNTLTTLTTTDGNDNAGTWVGQSPNKFTVDRRAVGSEANYVTNKANFNPVVEFDEDVATSNSAIGDGMTFTTSLITNTDTDTEIYYVINNTDDITGDQPVLLNEGGGTNRFYLQNDGVQIGDTPNSGLSMGSEQYLLSARYDATANTSVTSIDAGGETATATAWLTVPGNPWHLESAFSANNINRRYDGDIAEMIIYQDAHTPTQRQQIQSYLAIKYGITLSDGTLAYKSSTGADVWTVDATYDSDIFGIARDEISFLDQRISKSVNAETVLTISTDTDFTAANTTHATLTEGQFLLIGNDGNSTTTVSATQIPATVDVRVDRTWKAENTGTVGAVNLSFDVNASALRSYVLLVNNASTNFSGVTPIDGIINGTTVEFPGVTLNDGDIFTLGYSQDAPGGIVTNMSLWLKADAGATAAQWDDQSGRDHDVTAAAGEQPVLLTNSINFNPAFDLDGVNDQFVNPASPFPSGLADETNIFIVEANDVQGGSIFGFNDDPDNSIQKFHAHYPRPTNNMFFDIDTSTGANRVSGTYPFVTAQPTIAGFFNSVANNNQEIQVNGGTVGQDATGATQPSGVTRIGSALLGTFDYYEGRIAEVITYDTDITATEKQQVQSYLAIKYGITLNNGATAYLDATGNPVWAVDATYDNTIFGIARDDDSGLNQEISKSVNTGTVLTLSTSGDFTTANDGSRTDLTDGQFLMAGANGGATANQITELPSGLPSSYGARIGREWKIVNTGTIASVNLQFDGFDDTYEVLLDDDGDFSNGGTSSLGALNASGQLLAETALTGTSYITLAIAVTPFDCDGTLYQVYSPDVTNYFLVTVDPQTGDFSTGTNLTALGLPDNGGWAYNPGDNLAYYVELNSPNRLYSLDAANTLINLGAVSGVTGAINNAAISSNGTMYAIGGTTLYEINLTTRVATSVPVTPTLPALADIGVNPVTGNIYGYASGQLQEINLTTNTTQAIGPVSTIYEAAGAVYFTAAGEMIAYADNKNIGVVGTQEELVKIDLTDGTVTKIADGPTTSNNDGFSCAFNLNVGKKLETLTSSPGNVNTYTITFNNRTGGALTGLTFDDVLTTGFIWASEPKNEVGMPVITGTSILGTATANFALPDIPGGISSFDIDILVPANAVIGSMYSNQATVSGAILDNLGGSQATDDPDTPVIDDPTVFTISSAPGGINGGKLWLKANVGATAAQWDDQSGNDLDATANGAPVITPNGLNFNPVVTFDGSSNYEGGAGEILLHDNEATSYTVFKQTVLAGFQSTFTNRSVEAGDTEGYNNYISGAGTRSFWTGDHSTSWDELAGGTYSVNIPEIFGTNTTSGIGNATKFIYVNGTQDATTTTGTYFKQDDTFTPYRVGSGTGLANAADFYFQGDIAEQILFNKVLSPLEKQKTESYLALKYGITLNNGTVDYVASEGTVIWSTGATYNKDIAGIVRDDGSGLIQKVARSVNENSIVTMALDNDVVAANDDVTRTSTFANDLEAMVWSNNGASRGFVASNIPAGANSDDVDVVLERIWQVQERGDVAGASGNLHIAFDLDNLQTSGGTPAATDVYLLINGTDDFTGVANANSLNTGTIVGNQIVFAVAESNLETGQFFTLGCAVNGTLHTAPGGVTTNLNLWIRADDGVSGTSTVTGWTDQTGTNIFTNIAGTPQTGANDFNFNNTVTFDNDYIRGNTVTTSAEIYAVAAYADFIAPGIIFGSTGGGNKYYFFKNSTTSLFVYDGALSQNTAPPDTAGPHIFGGNMNGADGFIRYDGAEQLTYGDLSPITGIPIIGDRVNGSPGTQLNGDVSEVITFSNSLTTADRHKVESYLGSAE